MTSEQTPVHTPQDQGDQDRDIQLAGNRDRVGKDTGAHITGTSTSVPTVVSRP